MFMLIVESLCQSLCILHITFHIWLKLCADYVTQNWSLTIRLQGTDVLVSSPAEHLDVVEGGVLLERRQLLEAQLLAAPVEAIRAVDANVVVVAARAILHGAQARWALKQRQQPTVNCLADARVCPELVWLINAFRPGTVIDSIRNRLAPKWQKHFLDADMLIICAFIAWQGCERTLDSSQCWLVLNKLTHF